MSQVGCSQRETVIFYRGATELNLTKKINVVGFPGKQRETQRQALDRLYSDHQLALRKFLRARLAVGQDLDDIVQEVFAKLARIDNLPQLLPIGAPGNVSYLLRMANNLVFNHERHKAVRRRHLEIEKSRIQRESASFDRTPEHITVVREELDRLRGVIAGMRPNWRQAFVLNRFKQKTYKEIAIFMGVSVKQVEKYMQQALVVIRRALCEAKEAEK